jgi:flagellin-like hook-associated protein FlgL
MAEISLSKAVRSNLLSLQSTAQTMAKTQERLATGNKVNSALDNPTNFFTASALNSRASDMGNLMDSMSNGIKTIEAADNGLKSITKTVESMQSTLRQARQDKSFKTASYTVPTTAPAAADDISVSGGAVGTTPVNVNLGSTSMVTTGTPTDGVTGDQFTVSHNGITTANITLTNGETVDALVTKINTAIQTADTANTGATTDLVATNEGGQIKLTSASGGTIAVAAGTTNGAAAVTAVGFGAQTVTAKTADQLVSEINGNTALADKVRASNDGGKLRLENLSTEELTVTGVAAGALSNGIGTDKIGGNEVRKNLVKQFNELRDQLDKLADDASFNGINLLRGDKLKLTFNETGTSTIDIQAKKADGTATSINNTNLGIATAVNADFDSDTSLDAKLETLSNALGTLRSQASSFGSNLSIVQNRQDFTKSMINTLETGAANLTLADTNEEAANLLALQTRQQLSSTALSMASQADQAVLRLF